jgi:alkylhydroperoxidase family enzyme
VTFFLYSSFVQQVFWDGKPERQLADMINRGVASSRNILMRIARLERSQVDEPTQAIYDHFQKQRGNVPNMFRTVAHRPEILRTMIAHFRAVMESGTLTPKLKELVIVRTSQVNGCEY